MREVLFRAKKQDNGDWIEGYLCYGNIIKTVRKCFDWRGDYVCDSLEEYKVDKETVGQYVGVCDKNGKKIFEGDIVKVVYIEKRDFQGVKYDSEYELIEQIVYSEKNACFMLKIDCQGIPMYRHLSNNNALVKIKELEVIGNIHDNPELLEKDNA